MHQDSVSPSVASEKLDSRGGASTSRRNFVRAALAGAAGVAAVPLTSVAVSAQTISASPGSPPAGYGTLRPVTGVPGVNNVNLLSEFSVRVIAESGEIIRGTDLLMRSAPDGAATFSDDAGGWYYTVNHEINNGGGGVTSFHFNAAGALIDAFSILDNTNRNCAGGATPWGTWLSCEENGGGIASGQSSRIWECWPDGSQLGQVRPAMGTRNHEAVAADPVNRVLYTTEDAGRGNLWRFTPNVWGDLSSGVLEQARTSNSDGTGIVSWVSDGGTSYNGGEGIWFHPETRKVYVATKGDETIWELDTATRPNVMERVWQGVAEPSSPLYDPDNLTVASGSGDLYVAEDSGQLRVVLITPEGELSTFMELDTGEDDSRSEHRSSEVTGPVFNPAGNRMYVSSQRGGPNGDGVTYEITGPFRSAAQLPVDPQPPADPEQPAQPAQPAGLLLGTFALVNREFGTYLSESAPRNVRHLASPSDGSEWEFVPVGNGNYYLVNTETGRFLDTDGRNGQLIDSSTNGGSDDEWEALQLANGSWVFESAVHPSYFLYANEDQTLELRDNIAEEAQWSLMPTGLAPAIGPQIYPGRSLRAAANNLTGPVNRAGMGVVPASVVAGAASIVAFRNRTSDSDKEILSADLSGSESQVEPS